MNYKHDYLPRPKSYDLRHAAIAGMVKDCWRELHVNSFCEDEVPPAPVLEEEGTIDLNEVDMML